VAPQACRLSAPEGGGAGRISYTFWGAQGKSADWVEAEGVTLAAEILQRSARTTPRFCGGNTFWLGEAPVLQSGDMAEASLSISSRAGPICPRSSSVGSAQGGVERGVYSRVPTALPRRAPAGEPVNAFASASTVALTTTLRKARISCATRVACGLEGSSFDCVLAAASMYTPLTVTGLRADPAPPVTNRRTADTATPTTLHPASWLSSLPARRRAAPLRPVRGVRDSSQANLQDMFETVRSEWEAMDRTTISHCWVKA